MKKRGQVSLFVIMGIVIVVILIVLFLLLREQTGKKQGEISQNLGTSAARERVDNIITSCMEDQIKRAVENAGHHGGYALKENENFYCPSDPDVYNRFEPTALPPEYPRFVIYRYPDSSNTANLVINYPDTNIIKECLQFYIHTNLRDCFSDFIHLKKDGWNVNYLLGDTVFVTSIILEENKVEINIPVRFTRGSSEFTIDKYSYNYGVNFIELQQEVENLMNNLFPNNSPISNSQISQIESQLTSNLNSIGYDLRKETSLNTGATFYHFKKRNNDFVFKFGLFFDQDPLVPLLKVALYREYSETGTCNQDLINSLSNLGADFQCPI